MVVEQTEEIKILDYETSQYLDAWAKYISKNAPSPDCSVVDHFRHCLHPQKIPNKSIAPIGTKKIDQAPSWQYVACGRCLYCMNKKANEWLFRFKLEQNATLQTYFVTLTYRDDVLRDFHCLCLDHPQLFFKRLRRRGFIISYALLGEYGPHSCRPHYHCLIFLRQSVSASQFRSFYKDYINSDGEVKPETLKLLFIDAASQCWPYGFTDIKEPVDNHLYYIAKYTTKLFLPYAAFKTFSQKPAIAELPGSYLTDRFALTGDPTFYDSYSGTLFGIPRYFRKKAACDDLYRPPRTLSQSDFQEAEYYHSQEIVDLAASFQSFLKRKM